MNNLSFGNLVWGLVLSALVGYVGYRRASLTLSGWLGAVLVGTLMFGLGGWIAGLLLITFFVSSSRLTHYRQAAKQAVADKFAKGGRRDLGQALANGGLGALLSVGHGLWPHPLWFAGLLGAMAVVNADTWATELGVLSRGRPRLITTGQPVEPGTSGGVTWLGTGASVAGGLLIGLTAAALWQVDALAGGRGFDAWAAWAWPLLAALAGLAGSLLDSVLGATLQGIYWCETCAKETEARVHRCGCPTRLQRGWPWLGNDLVNWIASLLGAGVAAGLAWLLRA